MKKVSYLSTTDIDRIMLQRKYGASKKDNHITGRRFELAENVVIDNTVYGSGVWCQATNEEWAVLYIYPGSTLKGEKIAGRIAIPDYLKLRDTYPNSVIAACLAKEGSSCVERMPLMLNISKEG